MGWENEQWGMRNGTMGFEMKQWGIWNGAVDFEEEQWGTGYGGMGFEKGAFLEKKRWGMGNMDTWNTYFVYLGQFLQISCSQNHPMILIYKYAVSGTFYHGLYLNFNNCRNHERFSTHIPIMICDIWNCCEAEEDIIKNSFRLNSLTVSFD